MQLIVGDIHGCAKTFRALLDDLRPDSTDHVIILGDAINKGPNSKGVLDLMLDLRAHCRLTYIRGNHEQLLIDALRENASPHLFLEMGGTTTLKSFGIDSIRELPDRYLELIKDTPYIYTQDHLIMVHGGLDFSAEQPLQPHRKMCEIRDWYDTMPVAFSARHRVFHGHKPVPTDTIKSQYQRFNENGVLNLDNGCVLPGTPKMGHLAAYELKSHSLHLLPNCE